MQFIEKNGKKFVMYHVFTCPLCKYFRWELTAPGEYGFCKKVNLPTKTVRCDGFEKSKHQSEHLEKSTRKNKKTKTVKFKTPLFKSEDG